MTPKDQKSGAPAARISDASSHGLRSLHSETGAVMVEGALVLPLFLVLLLFSFSLIQASYVSIAGQFVVSEAAHWAAVGDSLPGKTREDSIKDKVVEIGRSFGLSVNRAEIKICPATNPLCTSANAAAPNEVFSILYTHSCQIGLLPLFHLTFGAFARNEPFA